MKDWKCDHCGNVEAWAKDEQPLAWYICLRTHAAMKGRGPICGGTYKPSQSDAAVKPDHFYAPVDREAQDKTLRAIKAATEQNNG